MTAPNNIKPRLVTCPKQATVDCKANPDFVSDEAEPKCPRCGATAIVVVTSALDGRRITK